MGARFGWLGGLRAPLRERAFGVLRQMLQTDDGRRILVEALTSAVPSFPPLDLPLVSRPNEFPELGRHEPRSMTSMPAPIFITGRFRSGSTLLWNIFRHIDGCVAYYEPLNERRWFDPAIRGSRVDATHVGVADYWREYDGLEHLGSVFHDDWWCRRLFMDEQAWDPDLVSYIQGLVDAAAPKRAVLQFNRVDFRLPWLRRWFPGARLLHIYRHPREQWCSSLLDSSTFPKEGTLAEFEPHDHFYLTTWVRDLRHRFPVLDERTAAHAYEAFYLVWRLSWLYGRRYADHSVSLERLTTQPSHELPLLLDAAHVPGLAIEPLRGLIAQPPRSRWAAYAEDQWFADREARCEALLWRWAAIPPGSADCAVHTEHIDGAE